MTLLLIFRTALKALGRNKMRTALTMLGMIIGVAAVITMVALGTGAPVIAARKIACTAAAIIPASSGTPYMAARKTSDALWNSALPGRLIDAASGRISVYLRSDRPSFFASWSIIGSVPTDVVVVKPTV